MTARSSPYNVLWSTDAVPATLTLVLVVATLVADMPMPLRGAARPLLLDGPAVCLRYVRKSVYDDQAERTWSFR
jgi:hypothetical protein